MALYWDIGRLIVERQGEQKWGKAIVENLAADLQLEFPGLMGFSAQNLWYMRQFYLEYRGQERLQPLVGEISWAKHLVVMAKCKDPLEREFYIRMTRKFGIILCKEKRRTMVEYALRDARKPIGVATYRMVRRLPRELQGQLPSPQQIGKLLEGLG